MPKRRSWVVLRPGPGVRCSRPGGETEWFHDSSSWNRGVPTSPGTFMWNILPSRAVKYPLFLKCCGKVTASGRWSRKSTLLPSTFVRSGRSPVSREAREGPHNGYWQ